MKKIEIQHIHEIGVVEIISLYTVKLLWCSMRYYNTACLQKAAYAGCG
jgi:hypothetical protein